MNPRFKKNRFWQKALCLFLIAAFLTMNSACPHPSSQSGAQQSKGSGDSSGREIPASRTYPTETPWWKKTEYEWLILTLLVIGAGIAAGATIRAHSGTGGANVGVAK